MIGSAGGAGQPRFYEGGEKENQLNWVVLVDKAQEFIWDRGENMCKMV